MTTALVLSAGGMFAAWEAGVWKAISSRFRPDLIVGASAGALNGWAIAGGATPQELIDEWLNPATAEIRLFRAQALERKAGDLWSRYQPRTTFALTVVEVPRLRPRLVRGPEVTSRHLAATCSIPCLFPPVSIDRHRYVDGGLMGALPLWAAQEMGAARAVAVNCLTTLPFRILRALLHPRRAGPLEVVLIEPSEPLGSLRDAVRWSRANVERWVALGERDGNRALSSITI